MGQSTRYQKLIIAVLSLGCLTLVPQLACAESVLERVAQTGTLTAGTSKEVLPFAFESAQGKVDGLSDLCKAS